MSSPPFIIDSHIHLWDSDDLQNLAWCKPDHVLARRCAQDDYIEAIETPCLETLQDRAADKDSARSLVSSAPRVGYVFVEADRVNGGDGSDWAEPLAEVRFVRNIIEKEADATSAAAKRARCLALVPWAPVHSGEAALERYLDAVQEAAGPLAWPRVRGFRYLLQDKPHGTMLTDDFVAGLKLLGRRGFSFDLGVDQHRRGRTQMNEVVALLERVHGEDVPDAERVVLVINHLAKPDLTVLNPTADRGFGVWRETMFALGRTSPDHVFVKVSGFFSEMPEVLLDQSASAIFSATLAWFSVMLAAFGASRLMFASDWPVCTAAFAPKKAPKPETDAETTAETMTETFAETSLSRVLSNREAGAWDKWRLIVAKVCYMATMSEEDEAMIWAGTAVKAYKLDNEA